MAKRDNGLVREETTEVSAEQETRATGGTTTEVDLRGTGRSWFFVGISILKERWVSRVPGK